MGLTFKLLALYVMRQFFYSTFNFLFSEMTCNRVTEVDGEPLKVQIQDTSDKVSFKLD